MIVRELTMPPETFPILDNWELASTAPRGSYSFQFEAIVR